MSIIKQVQIIQRQQRGQRGAAGAGKDSKRTDFEGADGTATSDLPGNGNPLGGGDDEVRAPGLLGQLDALVDGITLGGRREDVAILRGTHELGHSAGFNLKSDLETELEAQRARLASDSEWRTKYEGMRKQPFHRRLALGVRAPPDLSYLRSWCFRC